jgi:UDP-4-amino-4-deoxy-L-arabinose formyltransferase/UDP-glucuronic acid dehydrogenase (UDP-4-keto-hexauronic acid decarboxylating)
VVFGYHELGYACIQALLELGAPIAALFTHRDDPGEEIWWRSCAELAASHRIAVYFDEQFGTRWIEKIRSWAPAVIYSFNYRRLLSREVLQCASIGAFNMHPSKLPAYRGRAPINWVLVNGERETGVTLHYMVERADAGDIVGQETVTIDDRDTALTLSRKLTPLAAGLITRFHPRIVAGTAPRIAQNLKAGSYFGRRTPADGRIDWHWPARRIYNLVRALTHPYPGAFCVVGERKIYIWQASLGSEHGCCGEPGRILAAHASELEVAAGEGSIVVRRVQLDNEPEIAAGELPVRLAVSGPSLKQVQTLFN